MTRGPYNIFLLFVRKEHMCLRISIQWENATLLGVNEDKINGISNGQFKELMEVE